MDQNPQEINKHRKLPNTPTTMPRNTAAGKAAAGPTNTSDGETVAVSTPQEELAAANAEIERLRELLETRNTPKPIQVVSDHNALEYFITTKALTARQARWADILLQFNFLIIYRPGATNRMDALTRRKQDLDNQMAVKILLRTQTLLQLEHLNPRIQAELNIDPLDAKIYPINSTELNLINKLLQANCTAPSLQEYREKVKDAISLWSLKNGLLKHQERLVVVEEQNLQTQLIAKAHTQVFMAHPRKNKTYRIIGDRYYWPGMVMDINRYIQNCNDCYRSTIP